MKAERKKTVVIKKSELRVISYVTSLYLAALCLLFYLETPSKAMQLTLYFHLLIALIATLFHYQEYSRLDFSSRVICGSTLLLGCFMILTGLIYGSYFIAIQSVGNTTMFTLNILALICSGVVVLLMGYQFLKRMTD